MKSKNGKYTTRENQHGTYNVRFFDQEGRRRSKNFKTKTGQEQLIRAIRRGEDLDRWFPDPKSPQRGCTSQRVTDLVEEWFAHGKEVRKLSGSCLNNYKMHMKLHILPVIGEFSVHDLDIKDIEQVARSIARKKPLTTSYSAVRKSHEGNEERPMVLNRSYQREILITLLTFAKWLYERRYVNTDPFRGFKLPPLPVQPKDYWRQEDEDAFFDWIDNGAWYVKPHTNRKGETYMRRWQMKHAHEVAEIVLFALRTGMRLGEIGYLRMKDVNLEEGWIRVRGSYSSKEKRFKHQTKSNRVRMIEMNEDVRLILERYRHLPIDQPIFNVGRVAVLRFSEICERAGVRPIHFHGLRHTCLTNLANGYGMKEALSILKVQQIAGHSDLKTTMGYVHCEGIRGTSSLQLSREERKKKASHRDINNHLELTRVKTPYMSVIK